MTVGRVIIPSTPAKSHNPSIDFGLVVKQPSAGQEGEDCALLPNPSTAQTRLPKLGKKTYLEHNRTHVMHPTLRIRFLTTQGCLWHEPRSPITTKEFNSKMVAWLKHWPRLPGITGRPLCRCWFLLSCTPHHFPRRVLTYLPSKY